MESTFSEEEVIPTVATTEKEPRQTQGADTEDASFEEEEGEENFEDEDEADEETEEETDEAEEA